MGRPKKNDAERAKQKAQLKKGLLPKTEIPPKTAEEQKEIDWVRMHAKPDLREKQKALIAKREAGFRPDAQAIQNRRDASPEDIQQAVYSAARRYGFKPVMTDDECELRIQNFWAEIVDQGEMPTMEKLALHLGVTRGTLTLWRNGSQGQRRSEMINKAIEVLAAVDADLVLKRKIPEITQIFRSKNYYGMSDRTEHVNINAQVSVDMRSLMSEAAMLPHAGVPVDGEYRIVSEDNDDAS